MKKILGNVWEVLKQSVSEIKAHWELSRRVQGRSLKMKAYILVYMTAGFFLVYSSLCFISMLYILFGLFGGVILGIMESPFWFFLCLLPIFALPFHYFVHVIWTKNYQVFKEEYFIKHKIPRGSHE